VGAFGDKFRTAREKKNFSLDDVSSVTKISARMLRAIEEEHFDQLPGGVFNKGFIRAYAKHLGLNDQEAVTDYLACLRQAQIDAHEVWDPTPPAPVRSAPQEKRPSAYQKPSLKPNPPVQVADEHHELPELHLPRAEDVRPLRRAYMEDRGPGRPWSILAATALVVILIVALWMRHSHNTRNESANAAPTNPAPAAQTAPLTTPAARPPSESQPATRRSQQSATTPSPQAPQPTVATHAAASATPKPAGSPASITPANTQANQPTNNQQKAEKIETAKNNNEDSDVTVRTLPPVAPAKPAASMTLVIRASENSWISVTADGQSVTHETLIAPAATSIRASREIVARIGNAAGVTFLWNGQEMPAQGAEAEVKTFHFDSTGMREIPNQPPVQNH
jgi:cytoskeletal protein RodZ